ncbi:MAG: trimeric intracellular cation channel family protein [Acidobacteriota bacterium]|nr:trimeric intracellular cation channel family protein [Acidobacteriota bacterium]
METLLSVIEITAILVFAYSGIIHARKSGFDYVGVLTVALVSAFGGGTLRDVLLGNHPLYWIAHWEFLIYVLLLSPIALFLLRFDKDFSSRRTLMLIDALGLGLFTASGVGIALEMKTPILPAAFIGIITATFGGVLRDILCNQKPQLFQSTEPLYATCAFVGAWIYILMFRLDFLPTFALIVCIAVTFLLRISAVKFNLRLPF